MPMNRDVIDARWERLDELFHQAIILPPDQVETFCRMACGDDKELLTFLLELVAGAEIGDDRIRDSIAELAKDIAGEELLTGERVGAYHVDKLLARGGMGDVYIASRADGEFEKEVVIKIIRRRLNQYEFVQHFRTERQVLADLHHPSIPGLVDAGQLADGRPYFVCEYVDGVPLDRFCEDNKLTRDQRLSLIERVAETVQHAHNNLVLHLDIKPDNILVEQDGTPRLLDFGVARLKSDSDAGHKAFTPEYASPEQLRNEAPSAGSDVYSLGVLLYQVLTRNTPFAAPRFAPSETKIVDRQSFDEVINRSMTLTGLDRDLRAIVKKATALNRSERYASMEAFSRDLRNYRRRRPVSARKKTMPYLLVRYYQRHPIVLVTALGIVAILTAFLFREISLRKEAQAAYSLAEQETEASRQVSAFLVNLFEVSDPGEARGNTVTARELLDRGAVQIYGDLQGQPLVKSQMMRVMGSAYMQLGLHNDAQSLLENALQVRVAALKADDGELGQLLATLGILYLRQGQFDDAEGVLSRSLDIREAFYSPGHDAVAHSLNYIGVLKTFQNDYDEAESSLLRAISIYENTVGPEHKSLAESLSSLAGVYYRVGREAESEQLYKRAIAIDEKVLGPEHPSLAIRFDNLGNVFLSTGRHKEAIAIQQRALVIREKVLSPKHPMVAMNLDNLANAYVAVGQFEKAEDLRFRALAIREEVLDPLHPHIATSLGNLGALYLEQDQLDKAEDYLLRSIAIKEQVYKPDSPRVAIGMLNLGNVYFKRGELSKAEDTVLDAIVILKQNLTDDHLYRMYSDWQLANIYRGRRPS